MAAGFHNFWPPPTFWILYRYIYLKFEFFYDKIKFAFQAGIYIKLKKNK